MPGGILEVSISAEFSVRMRGEVSAVFEGNFADEMKAQFG
jgi:hypothetical protein